MQTETSARLERNAFAIGSLGAGQASRDIVRWAFNANTGEVSPELYDYQDPVEYYTNKYVVAGLLAKQAPGLPDVANIKSEIEQEVMKKKKGEMLKSRVQGTNLQAIANQFDTKVDTAKNVKFNAMFVPGLGVESRVIGKAFTMEQGQTSEPIVGSSGVFVIQLLQRPNVGQANNIPQLRSTMSAQARQQVPAQWIQAMKKEADIEDNRSRFY